MYFESHAHYDDGRFKSDQDKVLTDVYESGVSHIVNCGADMKSTYKSIELTQKYPFIYAAIGVHPHSARHVKNKDYDTLKELSKAEKVVAIGEIGLDYHYDNSPRDVQKQVFATMLNLCNELNLPVVIHEREAAQDTYDIIKASGVRRGVIHCYSGSLEMAKLYVDMGFHLGIGGVVTYANAKNVVSVAEWAPIEQLLIETDSPYLSPVPKRGTRNDSQNLRFIVEKISEIKQLNHELIAKKTKENGLRLFDIK